RDQLLRALSDRWSGAGRPLAFAAAQGRLAADDRGARRMKRPGIAIGRIAPGLLVVAMPFARLPSATAAATAPHGRVIETRIPAPSLDEPWRDVIVYLPPGYGDPSARHRRYPVV